MPGYTCPSSNDPVAAEWGTHKQLTLAVNPELTTLGVAAITTLAGLIKCEDSLFEEPTVPMAALQKCAPTADSNVLKSVRSCPGEPYDETNYFEFDSDSTLPYKRIKSLFNLYNWDL